MPTYFSIWCPLGDRCKKRGKCLATTIDEENARARLLAHLYGSPDHSDLTHEQREMICAEAEVKAEEWDDDGVEATEQPQKRPRYAGGGKGHAWDATLKQAVAEGVQAALSRAQAAEQESADSTEHETTLATAAGSACVSIPRSALATMLDNVSRAEMAARQAGRISQNAAMAFMEESNNLAAAKVQIEGFMNRWV